MFVGGVSGAGENSTVTAAREVAEELGLKRGLPEDGGSLSYPLFQCAICTSYNRCIVTVFTYQCNSKEETVTVSYSNLMYFSHDESFLLNIEQYLSGKKRKFNGEIMFLMKKYNYLHKNQLNVL